PSPFADPGPSPFAEDGAAPATPPVQPPQPPAPGAPVQQAPPQPPAIPQAEPAPSDLPTDLAVKAEGLERMIDVNSAAKAPYLQLAQLYADAGRKDLAIATYKRYLNVDPSNAYIQNRIQVLEGTAQAQKPVEFDPEIARTAIAEAHSKAKRILIIAAGIAVLLILGYIAKVALFPSTRVIFADGINAHSPVWSPKSDKLAFIKEKREGAVLCIYDVATKKTRELTTIKSFSHGHRSFVWSRTGSEIAYESHHEDRGETGHAIFVIDVSSGETKPVAFGQYPSWSPDGTVIAVLSKYQSGTRRSKWTSTVVPVYSDALHVADVLTGTKTRLTKLSAANPSFSPTDNVIVFEMEGKIDWEKRDREGLSQGKDMTDMLEGALSTGDGTDLDAKKGLAREMEAYEHDGGGRADIPPTDIYIVNADGTGLLPLTSDKRSSRPIWTRDGRSIVFKYYPEATSWRSEIWIMRPDGSDKHPLFNGIELGDTSGLYLTADGKTAAFHHQVEGLNPGMANLMGSAARDIHTARVGASRPKRLKNKHSFKQGFAMSPDGKRVAYQIHNQSTNLTELWLMSR
ncbi:hypothetical protein ACFLU6_05820, partial [Acidobacteriota bacterium]